MKYILLTLVLVVLVAIGIGIVFIYNKLINLQQQANAAMAQINVQLKRRYDLIPNIVKAVEGYTDHEKKVFKQTTEARTELGHAKNPEKLAKANQEMDSALKNLFAVAEDYPDLKASKNFQELQKELADTEKKIAHARKIYNQRVKKLNKNLKQFPANIVAALLRFKEKKYFEAEPDERKAVEL